MFISRDLLASEAVYSEVLLLLLHRYIYWYVAGCSRAYSLSICAVDTSFINNDDVFLQVLESCCSLLQGHCMEQVKGWKANFDYVQQWSLKHATNMRKPELQTPSWINRALTGELNLQCKWNTIIRSMQMLDSCMHGAREGSIII